MDREALETQRAACGAAVGGGRDADGGYSVGEAWAVPRLGFHG